MTFHFYTTMYRVTYRHEDSTDILLHTQITNRAKARLKRAVIFNSLNIVLVS